MKPEEIGGGAEVQRMSVRELGLRVGMALQTRRLVEGASKKESQYFGGIEGKGFMVGPLGIDNEPTGLTEGEICVVRGFTGQYEFSFWSKVLQTFEKPFAYALLAYPPQVDARLVRKSMRTKRSWPTRVGNAGSLAPVILVDISVAGAMIKSPVAVAAIGSVIPVVMDVHVDLVPTTLTLQGKICHSNLAHDGSAYFIGMAFQNVTREDKLVLHYLSQP